MKSAPTKDIATGERKSAKRVSAEQADEPNQKTNLLEPDKKTNPESSAEKFLCRKPILTCRSPFHSRHDPRRTKNQGKRQDLLQKQLQRRWRACWRPVAVRPLEKMDSGRDYRGADNHN